MISYRRALMFAVPLALIAGVGTAAAQQGGNQDRPPGDEQLMLAKTVDVGGNGLGAFDISFDDPRIELYILADRTNGSVDMLDTDHGAFIGRIGSVCP